MRLDLKYLNLWTSWGKTSLIVGLMSICGGSAKAVSLSNPASIVDQSWSEFINPGLIDLVSQSRSQPPEVIINTDPNSRNGDFDRSRSPNPPSSRNTSRNGDTRFTCDYVDGEYVVLYNPEDQASNSFPWAIPSALGGGWTPERRCNEITNRLENYRSDGLLEMSTGVENGYDTICVTTSIDPSDCRIVLTVPPGQDPQVTRDAVFENLLIADDGGATQGVYTYGDNGSADILNEIGGIFGGSRSKRRSPDKIDLRPFLDPSDGGTGRQLKSNVAPQRNNAPRRLPGSGNGNGGRKPAIFQ